MDTSADRAVGYRHKAAILRALARQTRFPDAARDLVRLADGFDKLAERVEEWSSLFPFDGGRRLRRVIVKDPVDAMHLVDDAVCHPIKEIVGERIGGSRHTIDRGDSP